MTKILILPYQIDISIDNFDYLSEGILEELSHLISTASNLKTTSRSTSMHLLNNPIPPTEMKERYDIDYVVEGNVKYSKGDYQLSTRLYDTIDEELLLQTQSPFKMDNWTQPLLAIANKILEATRESDHLSTHITQYDNSKARQLYLRGIYHWHRYTHEEMLMAIRFFKKSIKEDEILAISYAALADCYSVIGAMGYEEPIPAFKKAREFVNKSLVLNSMRSDSYVSAAFVDIYFNRDLIQANSNLEQAFILNSENVKGHHIFAMYYIHQGDFLKAEKYSAITIKLDPLALPHYSMMVRIQIYLKRYKQALDYINAAINIDSQSINALKEYNGYANLFLGNLEQAIDDFKISVEQDESNPMSLANLSYAYSKASFHQESRQVEQLIYDLDIHNETGVLAYALSIVKLGQSDYKSFFKYAEKAVQLGIGIFPAELKCNPIFAEVREDLRFQKILKQCNLADTTSTFHKNKKPATVLKLVSNTSEVLVIDPQDLSFVEASDNYCTIFWFEYGILKNRMLRITLKSLETQLAAFESIVRCHKTFMVNLHQELSISGNARGYFFESKSLPVRIPISRSKSEKMHILFEEHQG